MERGQSSKNPSMIPNFKMLLNTSFPKKAVNLPAIPNVSPKKIPIKRLTPILKKKPKKKSIIEFAQGWFRFPKPIPNFNPDSLLSKSSYQLIRIRVKDENYAGKAKSPDIRNTSSSRKCRTNVESLMRSFIDDKESKTHYKTNNQFHYSTLISTNKYKVSF